MKSLTKNLLILSAFFTLTASQCKKDKGLDPNGLPKATQIGANIFACKVNGENWVSSNKSGDIGGGINTDLMSVFGTNFEDDGYENFEILISDPGQSLTFKLDNVNNRVSQYSTRGKCMQNTSSVIKAKSTDGEVTFTKIDREKKIIAGTFWFDIPTDKCGVLKITEGRFDIRY